MANDCLPQVRACATRVSRLDPGSGVPLPGANNLYVSDALVSLEFSWEVEDGEEINEKNACGVTMVNDKAPDSLKFGTVTITLITPDPQLGEMLSQGTVLTSGGAVGLAAPPLGEVEDAVVSVELWTKRIRDGKIDTTFPYGWWVYPWLTNLRPDDHTHENAALSSVFVGQAYENDNWANGPLNDWPTTSDRVYQWIPTASKPDAACGYQTLAAS